MVDEAIAKPLVWLGSTRRAFREMPNERGRCSGTRFTWLSWAGSTAMRNHSRGSEAQAFWKW